MKMKYFLKSKWSLDLWMCDINAVSSEFLHPIGSILYNDNKLLLTIFKLMFTRCVALWILKLISLIRLNQKSLSMAVVLPIL